MALRTLIALLILSIPADLPGCGPYFPEALFTIPLRPDNPADFASGKLGIVQPGYERFYLVIAYRYLSGAGLSAAEQRAVLAPAADHAWPVLNLKNPWVAARNRVPGVKPETAVNPWREISSPGNFETYLNCGDDAFRTAAATLDAHIQQFGAGDPAVAEWLAAQDMVFTNCSQGPNIPGPATDPRLRADRAYQIASAKFYAHQLDAAREDFHAIARDASSPWHQSAPYLEARCLIRAGKWAEAESALERIAADPSLGRWRDSARRLEGFVRAHLDPPAYMHDVALALVKPASQDTIGQNLADYRLLFDKDIKPQPSDDLTDWVVRFQGGGSALEMWKTRRTLPWLVAALQQARPGDSAVPELLAAAREVKPDSPAYITAGYHIARLLPTDEARAAEDELLKAAMPFSARNQLRAARMQLARNFDEFLQFAPRRPVATQSDDIEDNHERKDYLDTDSTAVFNRRLPLSLWKQAAASTRLPENVRRELQRAIYVRGVMLASQPAFADIFTMLKTPGMRPGATPGYGRYIQDPSKIDSFRDNWWCKLSDKSPASAPSFLSAADQQQGEAEWTKLAALPDAPEWLGEQTLAFAAAHPADPRVPEALHLVVRATRYGCGSGANTGNVSHRAFDILHRRYKDSEWTKKTPYWYN